MQGNDLSISFEVLDTINKIPRDTWEKLFAEDIIENYGYQKPEESRLKEFSIAYLIARRGSNLIAVIPFFTMDFSLTTLIQGPLQKPILFIRRLFKRFLMMRLMFVGSPTAEELYFGIAKGEDETELFPKVFEKLYEISR
jgi:hypothetical protein